MVTTRVAILMLFLSYATYTNANNKYSTYIQDLEESLMRLDDEVSKVEESRVEKAEHFVEEEVALWPLDKATTVYVLIISCFIVGAAYCFTQDKKVK